MTLSKLSTYLYLFGNDCRMLHLNSIGEEFLTIHEELEDLYNIAFDFYDFVCESAISHNQKIENPSFALNNAQNEWNPVMGDNFTQSDILSYVITNGEYILSCIEKLEEYESWTQSKIDEFASEFDKIINYKFKQMKK